MVTIIDYGMGNIGSIFNMLKKIGVKAIITADTKKIATAEKIILPGVGSFDNGMRNIKELGLLDVLNHMTLDKRVPMLGICLGMQLLTEKSEEGILPGLGWINAQTIKFSLDGDVEHLKVPHMGWNDAILARESALTRDFEEAPRFYFVHSYYVKCFNKENVILKTMYGHEFASGIQRENIYGVQFHPEKSHKYGMKLLKNFSRL